MLGSACGLWQWPGGNHQGRVEQQLRQQPQLLVWGALSWQCLLDLSWRELLKHFQQFVPGASTEYPVMNPSTCTKIIPGFWGGVCLFLSCNLVESLVLFVIFFASAPHLWFYRSQCSQLSLFGFFSFSKLHCPICLVHLSAEAAIHHLVFFYFELCCCFEVIWPQHLFACFTQDDRIKRDVLSNKGILCSSSVIIL